MYNKMFIPCGMEEDEETYNCRNKQYLVWYGEGDFKYPYLDDVVATLTNTPFLSDYDLEKFKHGNIDTLRKNSTHLRYHNCYKSWGVIKFQ